MSVLDFNLAYCCNTPRYLTKPCIHGSRHFPASGQSLQPCSRLRRIRHFLCVPPRCPSTHSIPPCLDSTPASPPRSLHEPSHISPHASALTHQPSHLHISPHTSALTHQPSHISPHTSALTHHPSRISPHTSALAHQPSHISPHSISPHSISPHSISSHSISPHASALTHQPSHINPRASALTHQPSRISPHRPFVPEPSQVSLTPSPLRPLTDPSISH
jgi:hypothetical protein